MNTDKATPELWTSLAAAQAEIQNPLKNSSNPHYKSKYADLAEVLRTVLPTFSKHDLAVMQSTSFDPASSLVSVSTVVAHKAGGHVMSTASCIPARTDAQGVGAATTYLRRYALAAMAAVAQEDDDGNSARHEEALISADKAAAIEAECAELGVDVQQLVRHLNVRSLQAMPEARFIDAKRALENKRKALERANLKASE